MSSAQFKSNLSMVSLNFIPAIYQSNYSKLDEQMWSGLSQVTPNSVVST